MKLLKKRRFAVIILLLLIITSCKMGMRVKSVSANAFPSGNSLALPISGRLDMGPYHMYGNIYFTSDKPFEAQKQIVLNVCGEENVTICDSYLNDSYFSSVLIHMKNEDNTVDYYLLAGLESDLFLFSGVGKSDC